MRKKYYLLFLLFCLSFNCKVEKNSDSGLKPFSVNYQDIGDEAIDISFLLEKPAGKSGFITAQNGKLVKPDGTQVRLWGVNITDWTKGSTQIPEKEDARLYAKTLARYGINCVRLTFLDFFTPRGLINPNFDNTGNLDAEQLDKLDYWISQLKENGIYTDLNLLVGRTFKEGDNVEDYKKIGWAKYVSYFDSQLIELQKDFAKDLLTHYNPYTKSSYNNEPAIVIVELVNENTLFDAWHRNALHPASEVSWDPNFRNLTNYHSELLTQMFNNFIRNKFSEAEIESIRKQAQAKKGELISRASRKDNLETQKDWVHATISFYEDVEKRYFVEMKKYLKDTLSVKSLLIGSNDFLHNQSEYPMLYSNRELDIIDGHVYWQHPTWPGKINTPMVNEPDSSTIAKLSRIALAGMPYTVSEVNNAFPNDYESEGIPLISAYGSFQDWSGIMVYTFEPKTDPDYRGFVGDAFDISHHPVKMPQMIVGSLMYLRADVAKANGTVLRTYSDKQISQTMTMPVEDSPYYTPGYDASDVFKHKVRIVSLDKAQNYDETKQGKKLLLSDTKELAWELNSKGNGCVTINTPFTQAIIGFTNEFEKELDNLDVNVDNEFSAITLSSIDDKPINNSNQLLLITGAKVENTGQVWDSERKKIVKRGSAPSLVEVVSGKITLSNLDRAKKVVVKPLDGSGVPSGETIEAEKSGENWMFSVGEIITTWYKIEISR